MVRMFSEDVWWLLLVGPMMYVGVSRYGVAALRFWMDRRLRGRAQRKAGSDVRSRW